MNIDVSDIISKENKTMTVEARVEFDDFTSRLGTFPVTEKEPFSLCISNQGNGKLCIQGNTKLTIGIPCDRCLAEVATDFSIEISKEIDLAKLAAGDEETLEDTSYMIGKELDVDKLIFGEILVSWPMKVLCKEDCAGICKRCGTNLNLATCQCQETEPDPRMAAIQDIFNQFKEV
jgi:uncharacterized protein